MAIKQHSSASISALAAIVLALLIGSLPVAALVALNERLTVLQ